MQTQSSIAGLRGNIKTLRLVGFGAETLVGRLETLMGGFGTLLGGFTTLLG